MANRPYLLEAETATPSQAAYPEHAILLASSNSIPIFWYALFDRSCIVSRNATMEDGTKQPYPFLVSSTADAKSRYVERYERIFGIIPQSFQPLSDSWQQFLSRVTASHIHLEPLELWMMDEPERFLPHLERCLAAMDSTDYPGPEWLELLDQVQIDPDDLDGTVRPHKLDGYSWGGRPVTWV